MPNIRSSLVTAIAVCAAAIGGAAIASAATSTSSTTSTAPTGAPPRGAPFDPSHRGHTVGGRTETLLTGDTAAKVRAAALARVPGTVERVETNVDDSTPYEAHIVKSDGTRVIVEVNRDYSVSRVETMPGHP